MFRILHRRLRTAGGDAEAATSPASVARPGSPGRHRIRRWPLFVIASPAMVAIWSGWVSLGEMCGFGLVQPFPGIAGWRLDTAITLPVGVEAYGAYAMSAWLSPATPGSARKFAKWSALGSLLLGMLGQVAYHLLSAAHRSRAPWPVVVVVACLPVITLGFGAALAHLLHAAATTSAIEEVKQDAPVVQDHTSEEQDEGEEPAVAASSLLPTRLVEQARTLDTEHRLANGGKPISRDNLKLELGIATDKATTLIHIVRAAYDVSAADLDGQQADLPRVA